MNTFVIYEINFIKDTYFVEFYKFGFMLLTISIAQVKILT